MSILMVILMYGMWSSVFSIGKLTLESSPPIFLTSFRMLLAGLILTGFALLKDRAAFKFSKKQMLSLAVLGVLSIYLSNIMEFWGLQYMSSAKVCFIYSLSPFFAALFSYLHFKEKMNRRKWLGMCVGMLGMIPILMTQTGSEELLKVGSFMSLPELAIIGAALFSIYGWVLLRVVVKDQTITPTVANGTSMLIGGVLALVHSFFTESWTGTMGPVTQVAPFVKGTMLMTFVSNIVCYNIYGMMLKRYTATFLSFMGLLSPIFASILGWVLLREVPSAAMFGAMPILWTGLWLVYSAELKQGYIAAATPEPTPAT